jgi:hypothetical protein
MAVSIQIAIAGLCTLMHVKNGNPNFLPPPALIIPRADSAPAHGQTHPHVAFIAWDANQVTSTLTNATAVKVTPRGRETTTFVYVPLKGDEIQIKELPAVAPLTLVDYDNVAQHSEYWRFVPAPLTYDPRYVPVGANRNGLPSDGFVAGYFRFGGGKLTATRLTANEWRFVDEENPTGMGVPDKHYAREVDYEYDAKLDGDYAVLEITLADLNNIEPSRTIKLRAMYPQKDLKIYIGNAMADSIFDMVEPVKSDALGHVDCRSTHFAAIHMMAHTDNQKLWPYPEPTIPPPPEACRGIKGDSGGYCGPDGKP